ncbi:MULTISPECIES: UdgX family uracil-DNA binding protein [Streptomyces]|uniref:Type-4 uracil-DNA glycosylase n=1 Tax=Streptomyces lycii TaxID=2654337 RepID=A0ABQ7FNY4_9ACTN|nr:MULTISPECIES: UdgX family uracil-DNA binding protein [Streptomyces]KAF4410417.1 UdgX family uracil-DNA binding protein [Streptomyces lycii]PGH48907.1 uracil-DNA glycosylase [Streptomyces sp. Ru87]
MGPTDTGAEARYDAEPFVPSRAGLKKLREAAAGCRGCPLHEPATQTVFGAGSTDARVVLVGEQPGDQEDRRGEPFVGPAGRLLDKALAEAGIDPGEAYVTNAVKHFKYEQTPERGKRRIHKPPSLREMTACRPWLAAELALVKPELIVALGATAGKALLGPSFRVSRQRGQLLPFPGLGGERARERNEPGTRGEGAAGPDALVATVHPSAALRARDREAVYRGLVADLRVAAEALG